MQTNYLNPQQIGILLFYIAYGNEKFNSYIFFFFLSAEYVCIEVWDIGLKRFQILSKCKRVKNTTLYISSCPPYGSLKRVVVISLF